MGNFATQVAISSLTQAAGVATATIVSTTGLDTGNVVFVQGATPFAYNGPHSIVVVNATTFTFLVPSATASPATGTITYRNGILPYIPSVLGSIQPYNTEYSSTAYEDSAVMKTSGASLISLFGFNSGPVQWIQVHDSAAVPAPGAVPKLVMIVDTNNNWFMDIPANGFRFVNGITVVNSSDAQTYAAGADDVWFQAKYHD